MWCTENPDRSFGPAGVMFLQWRRAYAVNSHYLAK
jgi:hypothetical protein